MALYMYIKAEPKQARVSMWKRLLAVIPHRLPQVQISFPPIPSFTLPPLTTLFPGRTPAPAYSDSDMSDTTTHRPRSNALKITSFSIGLAGILMIGWVGYPIVSFEIKSRTKFANTIQPVPASAKVLGWEQVVKLKDSDTTIAYAQDDSSKQKSAVDSAPTDFTNVSNWLPSRQQRGVKTAGRIYYLSIPKLRIKDARVKIAGEDLDKSLIHYGGTGLPGDYGSAVIFGHSILPQFYDPENYKAIFSLLPDLDQGDEIMIKYDGITYRYVIYSMRVTTPDDISVLEQRYDASYITLITCVPPGTYWKRLEVKARLSPA